MKIFKIGEYHNAEKAMVYLYERVGLKKYSLLFYKKVFQNVNETGLPQYYICEEEGIMGYLLLIGDTMDAVFKPFSCMAIHHVENKNSSDLIALLSFGKNECEKYDAPNLKHLFEGRLSELLGVDIII